MDPLHHIQHTFHCENISLSEIGMLSYRPRFGLKNVCVLNLACIELTLNLA